MNNWKMAISLSWICAIGCGEVQENPIVKPLETIFEDSAEPNLYTDDTGQTYLSWIKHETDTTFHLQFSRLGPDGWDSPRTINSGTDWFVNWADFPSVVATSSGRHLVAHWLEMSADGTYDYDVRISQSLDGGSTWNPPFTIHTDGVSAEHGFVSLMPLPEGGVFAAWLDGRHTKGHDHGDPEGHGHSTAGAMTLRTASFDQNGALFDEAELDNRVCDCCQTSAALTRHGPIVAYRDRSEREVRDIAVVRREDGKWSEPIKVFNDGWQIFGCPVNGPVIRASGGTVAVSWFAIRDSVPEVKVAFSLDDGKNFEPPVHVDLGDPMGRVDLTFVDEDHILVTWLEKEGNLGKIYGRLITSSGRSQPPFSISETSLSRRSGFPRLTGNKAGMVMAWTHADSSLQVKTAQIALP